MNIFLRAFCLVIFVFIAGMASAERRVAFLVGNSNYEHSAPLDNPVRDVSLLQQILEGLEFEVTSHQNLTRDQIGSSLSQFLNNTTDADVTLFYYAGHGMQFEGQNYLVGVDAKLETEFDIESEAIDLDRVVRMLEKSSRAALVFVDACRDNPLANSFYNENFSETRAIGARGLAPVAGSYQGSMITFSASPGQVAYDGVASHSPFAEALAKHLSAENTEVLSLMKRVIRDVKASTFEKQVPIVVNDLTAEIYLKLGDDSSGRALALAKEEVLFEAVKDLNSDRAWEIYFSQYPKGYLHEIALATRESMQVAGLAMEAGVAVEDLTPDKVRGEQVIEIEDGLGLLAVDKKAVQVALNRLGYDAGPADGVLGRRSRQALADYQVAQGLAATGAVTEATAAKLGLALSSTDTAVVTPISSRDARKYDPIKLALVETDDRLIKAAKVFRGKEFRYGYFDNHLYIAVLDWSNPSVPSAQRKAEKAGGYLVSISSAAENRFVAALSLADERLWKPNGKRSWMFGPAIGLYQLDGSREPAGGWVWLSGEKISYSSWSKYEPTNHNNNESTAVFFVDYAQFARTRSNPRPLSWGDVSGPVHSYVVELD